jgi:hypothetical protein
MSELALGEIAPGDYTMQLGYEALKAVRVAAEKVTFSLTHQQFLTDSSADARDPTTS